MTWPVAVDAQGWMRKTERRIGLLERRPTGSSTDAPDPPDPIPVVDTSVPIGAIIEWPSYAVPAGFLLCDGQAVSRTTYADLFHAIGILFGVGDGTTTFNLPNKKGRVGVGYDAAQIEFERIAQTGGEKTHTLTVAEIPAHNHTPSVEGDFLVRSAINSGQYFWPPTSGGERVNTSVRTGVAGGDAAHNNLQPYQVFNYVINALNKGGSGGGGGSTTIAVQDTTTLDLTLTGDAATGYTIKGDVLGIPNPTALTVVDSPTLDLTLTGAGTPASPFTIKGDVLGGTGGGGAPSTPMPAGVISPWSGTGAVPSNWLLADGSAVSRTTYADLFSAIGTTYGVGDNSTTFNLPNLKGRVPVGQDVAQSEFDALGETGGEKAHTLSVAEIPSHQHTFAPGGSLTTYAPAAGSGIGGTANSGNTGFAGGDGAHNNLQPYITLRYLISTGAQGGTALGSAGAVGEVIPWPTNAAPADFLLCQGQAVSRTTYAALFAVLGTQYGVGDNTTTFNVPNLQGRVVVGKDAAQSEFDVLGETGGAKNHRHAFRIGQPFFYGAPVGDNWEGDGTNKMGAWSYANSKFMGNDATAVPAMNVLKNNAIQTPTTTTQVGGKGSTGDTDVAPSTTALPPYVVLNYAIRYRSSPTDAPLGWSNVVLNAAWTNSTYTPMRTGLRFGLGWLGGNRLYSVASQPLPAGAESTIGQVSDPAHYPAQNAIIAAIAVVGSIPIACMIYIRTTGVVVFRAGAAVTFGAADYLAIPNTTYAVA